MGDYFEETLRFLDRLEKGYTYSMSIRPDKDGYIDKECHKEGCHSKFKVNVDDWKNLFRDEAVYCPFCGRSAPSDEWFTTEQRRQLEQQALKKVRSDLNKALQADVKSFNKEWDHNGFISMSMSFNGDTSFVSIPAKSLEEMQQKNQCDKCGARYAVIGSAFYCPCCGKNSAKQTFYNTIMTIEAKINHLPEIKVGIAKSSKDDAERICSSMQRSCITELVVAIQVLCECVYPTLKGAIVTKENAFQRLDESDTLWKNVCGYGYSDWLSADEYVLMKKYYQQRHVLQHNDGIVDQKYIDKSNDINYQVGQRLIINANDVLTFAEIVKKVGKQILALS